MLAKRANEIIGKFADQRVLVVGDIVLDHYIRGAVERLNPEAPVPILQAKSEMLMTGGAGNTAKNAASLGAQVTLLGVAGEDPNADLLVEQADSEGYRALLVRDGTRPTIRKVRFLVRNQQMLRVDYELSHNISADVEDAILSLLEKHIPEATAVIVSDYAKGTITARVAEALVRIAKQHNVPVAADVKPSRAAYFVGTELISPNLKEGHEYLGLNYFEQGGQSPASIAKQLQKKMGANVYLTLGAEGMYVCAADGTDCHVPQAHVAEVFDVSGAGDTAVVALVLARLAGANHTEAADIGNAAGAVVVGKIGSVGLSPEELFDMLKNGQAGQA